MKKQFKLLWNQEKNYIHLASVNREAVNEYNDKTLSALLLLGWVLMLFPLAAVPFSSTKAGAVPAYIVSFLLFFVMFLLFKIPNIKKHTYCGLYAAFSVFFLLGIYLSVIHSPVMRATILLGGFVIMPLSFIDRPGRNILFLVFWRKIIKTMKDKFLVKLIVKIK